MTALNTNIDQDLVLTNLYGAIRKPTDASGTLELYAGTGPGGHSGAIIMWGDGGVDDGMRFYCGNAALDDRITVATILGATDTPFLNMHSHQIKALLNPSEAQDAATRNYVDTAVAELPAGAARPSTYDAIVFQDATYTYAYTRAGVLLSSVTKASKTDHLPIQAALDYLDGLALAAFGTACHGYKLEIGNGNYYVKATLHVYNPHTICGAGKASTRIYSETNNVPQWKLNHTATFTAEAGTSTTHVICTAMTEHTNDLYVGGYVYDITTGVKGLISAYNGTTHDLTVATMAGMAAGNTFVVDRAWTGYRNVAFKDIWLDGQATADIGMMYCPENHKNFSTAQTFFENCKFYSFKQYGIIENSNYGSTYINCSLHYCGRDNSAGTPIASVTHTAQASTDARHIIGNDLVATDDYYNGWYVWNITKSAGRTVWDYTGATQTLDFLYNEWDEFGGTAAASGDSFIFIPPFCGIYVKWHNIVNIIGCEFETCDNSIVITGCYGGVISGCMIQSAHYFGIMMTATNRIQIPTANTSIYGQYFESNGVWNADQATTVGFNDIYISSTQCRYINMENIHGSDSNLTVARNSCTLKSRGTQCIAKQYNSNLEFLGTNTMAQSFVVTGTGSRIIREMCGATSVADGGTITHNLGCTPNWCRLTCITAADIVTATTLSSTTITVAKKHHDGAAGTTEVVYWQVGV